MDYIRQGGGVTRLHLGNSLMARRRLPVFPRSWGGTRARSYMGNVDSFLKSLLNFDKDNVPGEGLGRPRPRQGLCLPAWSVMALKLTIVSKTSPFFNL